MHIGISIIVPVTYSRSHKKISGHFMNSIAPASILMCVNLNQLLISRSGQGPAIFYFQLPRNLLTRGSPKSFVSLRKNPHSQRCEPDTVTLSLLRPKSDHHKTVPHRARYEIRTRGHPHKWWLHELSGDMKITMNETHSKAGFVTRNTRDRKGKKRWHLNASDFTLL